jgi:long-chain acyl-CoA synthetase
VLAEQRHAVEAALAESTLCGAFQVTAGAGGSEPALVQYGSERVVTWEQYAAAVRSIAGGLHALGVRAGDTVALLLRNQPTFNVVDTAVLHLGAVPFSIYHTEPVEQMVALVRDSEASVIVTEPAFLERIRSVVSEAAHVRHVIVDGGEPGSGRRELALDEVARLAPACFDFEASWRAVGPESTATLVYTSGTTGEPKAVQIPHRAIMESLRGVAELAPTPSRHVGVSFLPAAHITDRFICHYSTIGLGGTLTLVPDPDDLWDAIRETKPTRFFGVPRTCEKLADRARAMIETDPALGQAFEVSLARVRAEQGRASEGPPPDEAARAVQALAAVREHLGLHQVEWFAVAAAPSSYEVLEFHHALGLKLAELWGMTEFMMALMNPNARIKLGTVGIPLPAVEVRLAGDGELLLRGGHACTGYRNDPDKAAAMRDADGWLHSGDLANVDEDGYFSIVGRKKEQMINSSGKNLFPAKIENAVLQSSSLLGHVCAIGDRRRYVTALIVLDPERLRTFAQQYGLAGSHAELVAAPEVRAEIERAVSAGNERLARVEQVRGWAILEDVWEPGGVELTNTMKLRRSAIDEKYAALIETLYA